MKKLIPILCLGAVLLGCARQPVAPGPVPTPGHTQFVDVPSPTPAPSPAPWWKTAVFYEIFVRSFYDSDGDGIGDFNGITQKLDYLNDGNPATTTDLGINALWLMPIHPSPSYHGYDVTNYYAVNSEYGTMEDFKRLLDEAHKRGIKIIIDLVLNHTSSQHPFFMDALSGENSTYHDWYVWSPDDQGNGWHPAVVGEKPLFYYGYFCDCMPDLNYRNPDVTAQMEKVSFYWLETIGVDGFRIDAAKHLIEDGKTLVNSTATHEWYKGFYPYYKGINPSAYVVGEVASSDARVSESYTGNQMDQVFNFEMASGLVNSVNGEAVSSIKSAVTFTLKDMPDWNFGTFLTNHDQNRVMSVLGGNVAKAKLAAFILLTSPGTPYLYYGEEIGMQGQKPDEMIRRPMQWSSEPAGGFTAGLPWEEPDPDFTRVNVQTQDQAADSLLNTYRTLIQLRADHPALSIGSYIPVQSKNTGVYAFLRTLGSDTYLILVNLTKNPLSDYSISGAETGLSDGRYAAAGLMDEAEAKDLVLLNGGFSDYKPVETLQAYTGYVFNIHKK